MKILENILSEFKEILYDVIIYILPGFICLLILIFGFSSNNYQSLIYSFLLNSDAFKLSIPPIVTTISFLNIFILITLSYILGTLLIYLSSRLNSILQNNNNNNNNKFLNFIIKLVIYIPLKFIINNNNIKNELNKNYIYLETIKNNLITIFKSNRYSRFFPYCNLDSDEEYIKFMKTYASTNSRFSSHNDLIQKYITKQNFYFSLTTLSLILFFDLIISSVIICYKVKFGDMSLTNKNHTICIGIFLFLFLIFCLRSFYRESYRHKLLREKECYLYLYSLIK